MRKVRAKIKSKTTMKKILTLLLITILLSCNQEKTDQCKTPKKVIVAGKIINFNKKKPDVKLYVNKIGANQTEIYTKADSLGNFQFSFETYIPTDVWLDYKMNFLVLTNPGDSIYVEFDGKHRRRPKILESIKFSGDAAKTNQDAAKFQHKYFSNPLYTDRETKEKIIKESDLETFKIYLDTLQNTIDNFYIEFVAKVKPNEEVKTWAKTYLENDFSYQHVSYPDGHRFYNKLSEKEWDVPFNYYEPLKEKTKISTSEFISGYATSGLTDHFLYYYMYKKLRSDNEKIISKNGGISNISDKIKDSLIVDSMLKYTTKSLRRQLVFSKTIHQYFDEMNVHFFEKNKNLIESTVTEPFLIEPLLEKYHQVKEHLNNPKTASNAMLQKIVNSSAKQVMDSILDINKNKVIYLDTWATWCAPCKSEMPNSKKLMKKLKGKDVAFVYLCIDSKEPVWKANLSELQLPGQHYFLNQEQSTDFRKAFEVNGIPHYFLIDKNGVILEKGSHLRPNGMENKILDLLK